MEGRRETPQHLSLWAGIQADYILLPQLQATDADEGEFGRVWYRILQGEQVVWEGRGSPSLGRASLGYQGSGSRGEGAPGPYTRGGPEGRNGGILQSPAPS